MIDIMVHIPGRLLYMKENDDLCGTQTVDKLSSQVETWVIRIKK